MVRYIVVTRRRDMTLKDIFGLRDRAEALTIMRATAKQERSRNPEAYLCTFLLKEHEHKQAKLTV